MKMLSLLGSVALVSGACLASCGGATDTELFGSGASSGSSGASGSIASSASGGTGSSGASGTTTSSSGASGATSSGASGTTSSSSGTSTSGGPATACNVGDPNACLPDEYCQVTACAESGTCAKRPAETPGYDPQCGCDKITYWNANVAGFHGVNISVPGLCAGEKVTKCSALKGCPGDTSCNYDSGTKNQCNAIDPNGTCWQLPKSCPDLDGGRTKRCFGGDPAACSPLCNAIKQERPFYKVTNCQ